MGGRAGACVRGGRAPPPQHTHARARTSPIHTRAPPTHPHTPPPQVLVYFAVAKKGETPTDGKTDVNPEGLTAACGPHAAAFAARLHGAGLSCKARALGAWGVVWGGARVSACGRAQAPAGLPAAPPACSHCSRARRLPPTLPPIPTHAPPSAGAGPPRLPAVHAGEAGVDLRLHAGGRAPRRLHWCALGARLPAAARCRVRALACHHPPTHLPTTRPPTHPAHPPTLPHPLCVWQWGRWRLSTVPRWAPSLLSWRALALLLWGWSWRGGWRSASAPMRARVRGGAAGGMGGGFTLSDRARPCLCARPGS